jgi:DNA-binding transcriptional ArsR family regulator
MAKYRNNPVAETLSVARALGDEHRLRALLALRRGELCVCQLIALLGLAPSTVSKHLSVLRQAGLVAARKEGRWMHYRLPDDPAPVADAAIRFALSAAVGADRTREDDGRLREILKTDPAVLCRTQYGSERTSSAEAAAATP